MRLLPLAFFLPTILSAQTKVLVIGDSLSAEYQHQIPFSAPDSPISESDTANTVNWVEVLIDRRGAHYDFGNKSDFHFDVRGPGYEYNWGAPGADTMFWKSLFEAEFDIFDPFSQESILSLSKDELLDQVDEVDVAVVLIGGNDVNQQYGDLYDGAPDADFPQGTIDRITLILEALRDERSDLPIILTNIPDIGATPDIQEDHPDPAKRATASALINGLNTQITTIATTFNATPVDFATLTTDLLVPGTFFIGSQPMVKSYGPNNPPDHLFCKLKFHPSSGLNALLANRIIKAMNAELGTAVTTLPNREIIEDVLGLDPDQAFLDWIGTHPGATSDPSADDDGDTLDALAEMALGTNPLVPNFSPQLTPDGLNWMFSFVPDEDASRYVQTVPVESTNLELWTPIPPSRLTIFPDGTIQATLPTSCRAFGRLSFPLQP